MVRVVPHIAHSFQRIEPARDPLAASEAADEAAKLISHSQKPIIVAGVEIHRLGLQDLVLELAEKSGIPIVSTLLGKSVISERHPLFLGLYEGAMGQAEVTRFVEESDPVLLLGTFMTDINLGLFTCNLDPERCIYATSEQLRIRHHHYDGVSLEDFLKELIKRQPEPPKRLIPSDLHPVIRPYQLEKDQPMTISRLIERLNEQCNRLTRSWTRRRVSAVEP